MQDRPPLVAHVIFALRMGGLENGLVNLINRTPPERYRHAVLCLTGYDDFARRIRDPDVPLFALDKRPGHDLRMYRRLWRLFRELRPAVVHTRNFVALDAQVPALLAGVRGRVHGEHGRDVHDLHLANARHLAVQRLLRRIVRHYVPLSADLERHLRERVGVQADRITRICNGVDSERFRPAGGRSPLPAEVPLPPDTLVIGTVGRMEMVKDPLNLVHAFVRVLQQRPALRSRLRLAMLGDGSLHGEALRVLGAAGALDLAWLPGARADVPALMRRFDVFALPSLAEGISNTILEAMASALPVVATRVGGNAELIVEDQTGILVPPADPDALARGLLRYLDDEPLRRAHGLAARRRIEQGFSLERMVQSYLAVYDRLLSR